MPDRIYNVKWNDVTKKAYVYDGLGRITSETVYPVNSSTNALESTYTYKNLTGNNTTTLVSGLDNAAGTTFYTYDANGNIIQTMHCDSNLPTLYYEAAYSYDSDGKRVSKYTDDGDTFFTYAGDILAGQKTGDNVLVWIYDNNGTEYYYIYK